MIDIASTDRIIGRRVAQNQIIKKYINRRRIERPESDDIGSRNDSRDLRAGRPINLTIDRVGIGIPEPIDAIPDAGRDRHATRAEASPQRRIQFRIGLLESHLGAAIADQRDNRTIRRRQGRKLDIHTPDPFRMRRQHIRKGCTAATHIGMSEAAATRSDRRGRDRASAAREMLPQGRCRNDATLEPTTEDRRHRRLRLDVNVEKSDDIRLRRTLKGDRLRAKIGGAGRPLIRFQGDRHAHVQDRRRIHDRTILLASD
jgi:hypothetical protein